MITSEDYKSIWDCLDIEEYKSFLEAIEENVFIPESRTFWSSYRTPYFKYILDNLENPNIDVLSLMIPSQIGKSQLLSAIAIEWASRYPGELVLYYAPTDSNALDAINKKIIPCIENSPTYQKLLIRCENGKISKDSITKNSIKFANGSEIKVLGVAGKTSLVSKTASLVVLDEYSRMRTLAKDSGDILSLAKRRMTAKSYGNRKLLVASTPLQANEDIHKLHLESRQITWEVPCPKCDTYQYLDFGNLKWSPKSNEDMSDIQYSDMIRNNVLDVHYDCPFCGHHIKDNVKAAIINRGRVINNGNPHLSERNTSMHLNGLYSLEHWEVLASDFILAKNDTEKLKEFRQQALCSPWEVSQKIQKITIDSFARSELPKGIFPENAYKVVTGIDVQDDIMYYVDLAIDMDKKIHLVQWGIEKYSQIDINNPESWIFRHEETPKLDMLVMDCGDGGNTNMLLELASNLSKCQPIKGYNSRSYSSQYLLKLRHEQLLFVPLQETNELLESLILAKTLLLPVNVQDKDDIFTHISNVVKKNGRYVDRQKGSQNHTDYRDALRYALAYMYSVGMSTEIDKAVYIEANKKEIEAKKIETRAKLSNLFSVG